MSNLFLNAVPTLGIEFMDSTWITVAIVLIVVGEIAMGAFAAITDESIDCVFFASLGWVFVCIFWPATLLLFFGIIAVVTPLFIGYYVPRWIGKYVKNIKEKKRKGVNKLMYKD
jgi:hypothetical protein